MSYAGNTLSLIRSMFSRKNEFPQPEVMKSMIWKSMYPEYGGTAAGGVAPLSEGNTLLQNSLSINTDLMTRYADYQDMSSYPECFSALNILADEASQFNQFDGDIVTFESPHEQIKEILEFTFNKQLKIQDKIWSIARVLAKYGDTYREIVVKDGVGVVKLIGHRPQYLRRIQDEQGHLYGFVKDQTMAFKVSTETFLKRINGMETPEEQQTRDSTKVYESWEMVHFRLDGDEGDDLYGCSSLDGARWAWKRLQQMEDAMVIHKLTRAQQRYVYYIDVGDVPPNEARKILNTVKQEYKKQRFVDPQSGKPSLKYNVNSLDEDLFIARRKDKRSTEVEVLSGLDSQTAADAEYFRGKLISSLGIPKSYLGYDETIGRNNLGMQDIRLARSVMRLQRAIKAGLRHIAEVDLAARNIDPDSVEFDINMTIPSGALEVAHMEVQKAKTELASQYQGLEFPEEWIWKEVLGISDDEYERIQIMRGKGPQGEEPQGEGPGGETPASLDKALSPETPSDQEGPLPAQGGETPPEGEEPEAEAPKGEKPGVEVASKYRKIDKSKQLMESNHKEVVEHIIHSDKQLGRRIHELKALVQEIRQAIPQKKR